MTESEIFIKLAKSVKDGEPKDAAALTQKAQDQGLDSLMSINEELTPGITRVSELAIESASNVMTFSRSFARPMLGIIPLSASLI